MVHPSYEHVHILYWLSGLLIPSELGVFLGDCCSAVLWSGFWRVFEGFGCVEQSEHIAAPTFSGTAS